MSTNQRTVWPKRTVWPVRVAVLLATITIPAGAWAAPFCLGNQAMTPQCIYYDAGQCERDADRQNAACSVNPAEFQLQPGAGKYCLVTSSHVSMCDYFDRGTCARDAAREGGTCSDAPEGTATGAPDPYSDVEGQ